ncbi:IMPACT family protein [Nesterenkonia halobia]|uniref:YigZ family protein n=1 Tax=Nesterenkonia halobia TaxID=37922 RepID=A0ABP6RDC9_9MICC
MTPPPPSSSATPDPASCTVLRPGVDVVAEIERRKSRFLAVLRRTSSPEEAQELVDALRREHHAARHHCSAWLIGSERHVQRANDDGEPSGTAGAPMLEVLAQSTMPSDRADLTDVAAVVVRWFGGTLLGAGGLVRAYSDAVGEALQQAAATGGTVQRRRMRQFRLDAPIADVGRWEHELRGAGAAVRETEYGVGPSGARLHLAVPDDDGPVTALQGRIATLSAGAGELRAAGVDWVDVEHRSDDGAGEVPA